MNYEQELKQELILDAIRIKIEKQYYSLNNFCQSNNEFDVSDLSKFLKGKKQWNYVKFLKLLMILETEIRFSWFQLGGYTQTGEIRVTYDPYRRKNLKFQSSEI